MNFDRLFDYIEARQFRKERRRRQNMRYLMFYLVALLVLLSITYIPELVRSM
jgi:hypothetical protein